MLMCDFCALSPRQRADLLHEFHDRLQPDGKILLDVYSIPAFEKREETVIYQPGLMNGFRASGKYYGFMKTCKYKSDKVVLDKYFIVEQNRQRTIYNWLQYFTPEALHDEFKNAGLELTSLFADVAGGVYNPCGDEFSVAVGLAS